jgi:hypothetical protein
MKQGKIYVDFNEMLEPNLVLLSTNDEKIDSLGRIVSLCEGLKIAVFMDDVDESGNVDNLVARGEVEKNNSDVGWATHVKWCCRIDENGIKHESELKT